MNPLMAPAPAPTAEVVAAAGVEGLIGVPAGGVLLRLGASRYAVAMGDVAEVAAVPRLTRVPGAPLWLAGVANWRGRMLPVLDLRPLLAAEALPLPGSARLVVLARDGVVAGVVAEAVPGVYDGELADPAPAPPTLTADAASLVLGQVADRSGPIAVLDAAAVLMLRERVDRRRHVS
jgi:purine-binding chemotaxis protein CheW